MAEAKKNQNKNKETQQYIKYCLLMVSIVLIAFIGYKLYDKLAISALNTSTFTKLVENISLENVKSAINTLPEHGFILISYSKDENVAKFEKDLKKIIKSEKLKDNFRYIDATDKINTAYIDILNETLNLEGINQIEKLPAIIYYKDKKVQRVISSNEVQSISTDEFYRLLDSYEIIKNN